uniref:Uncharacterized protein n=1 Tax=Mucochytrium quahogii TaxID=96639 RepID=A0A7S2RF01_9STRA|mmetsp:Transcript_14325/g.23355  ORF Transcript_14325/g.23355 Transcript_14325/m.23355 type:complete len:271 (+) Transcript_14325:125-937(+)|eukprot:CAMPEP_0203754240 /NCGR_PEP_ID=MMETSP0098-20131031/7865_1 /ASSEMBLY_ACC=CAM_ASM_000208 /TAXON_ID=96639 /ORGANISM=" , Strain NY0313808BC1" /LENGTH=270 /DNA_ID=CAMNT_0050645155 /DNA_START=120 /DNA_END=932 /DNA_ORIENTATION=+
MGYEEYQGAKGGSMCAGLCNCCAFILAVFAAASPYWVWTASNTFYSNSEITSTGAFVLSQTTSSTTFSGWRWITSWVYWSNAASYAPCSDVVVDSTFVDGSMYSTWGQRYGYCDGPNGSFEVPSKVKVMEAFSILCAIFAFFAIFGACATPKYGSKSSMGGVACSCLAFICAVVAFAVAASYPWYKDLVSSGGSVVPVLMFNTTSNSNVLVPVQAYNLQWGPGFWSMVAAAIITFCTSISLIFSGKAVQDDLDGGAGKPYHDQEASLAQT